MWKEWKEILAWFRHTEEASTPEQSAMDGLMRLVAATTMASLNEAQQRRDNPPHLSDAEQPPAEKVLPFQPESSTGEDTALPTTPAQRQPDEQIPPADGG